MKKVFISAMLLCAGLTAFAQLVNVASVRKVALPEGMIVNIPTISPDGNFVVVSDAGSSKLSKVNLTDGAVSTVTPNGNGSFVAISADGSQIAFTRVTTKNRMRYNSLHSVDLNSGKEQLIVKPTRKLNAGVALKGNVLTAVANGKAKAKGLAGAKAANNVVVSINYGHLDVNINGKSTSIDPQGRGSYLWPSLSPDGTKVVYYLSGDGCYVCNLDGSNPVALGKLRAARWMGNDMVVGMTDVDNGEFVTASNIVASDLKGNRQVLTDNAVMGMYPTVSADASKVAFTNPAGELYVIDIK